MINNNNHPSEDPKRKKDLCDVFKGEHDRSWVHKKKGLDFREMEKPETREFEMAEYLNECSVLPESAKNAISEKILPDSETLPRNFEAMYPRGLRFCMLALPFMDSGFDKKNLEPSRWEEFLNEKRFVKYLTVDSSADNLTFGLGDVPVYIYDFFPATIKKDIEMGGCSFDLDYPYSAGDARNREWFLSQCRKAANNLGKIVRGEA